MIRAFGLAVVAGLAGCSESPTGTGTVPTRTATDPDTDTDTTSGNATETASGTASPTETTAGATETPGVVDVAVGPDGRLRFDPETVEITVGDTVRWSFESAGHNVTAKPGASEKVSIPDDAEPFASYEGDMHYAINDVGTTYEHTFSTPGEYTYVCEPHADQGMVGDVIVSDG